MLAGSMCVLPFLLPYHQLPIKSFQAEWLAVALGIVAVLAFARAPGIAFPVSARWLLVFALLLLTHSLLGAPAYPQLPLTGALYVLYAGLMILLGARLAASLSLDRAATSLACFLLAGALLTALAGVIQFYGRPVWLEDLVAELRGGRAYGNIAQSNLYALYLAWGLASLLFLWVRGNVSTGCMLAGTAVLNLAAVLSGSRGWLLYLFWIALLLYLSCRQRMPAETGRRRIILAILFMTTIIQVGIPWMNQYFELGASSPGGLERALSPVNYAVDSRWPAWLMGWRIFTGNMLFGTGLGEFAGAAFAEGLPLLMAQQGTVWTSPHNILLQLLAETGIAGTILVAGALATWCWKVARTCDDTPVSPAVSWVIACVGVIAIQSLIEYPLWNAHFLGVTALLMGLVEASAAPVTRLGATVSRVIMGTASLVMGIALAVILRDYVKLDSVLITGTTQTLSTEAQRERDKSVVIQVAQGPLSPIAELWLMRGLPLNRADLPDKLAMSARVIRYWPENSIVTRRAVLLALAGNKAEAGLLLAHTLKTFPALCGQTKAILAQTAAADNAAIAPLHHLVDKLVPHCR